jgi:polyisoprenyl-teichoic acid--peptidoglycan teichoic acid transferase
MITRISARHWILWCVALVAAVGLFFFARGLTACWRLTALPGVPPGTCQGARAALPGAPPIDNHQGVSSLPTQSAELPEVAAPQWDGGSRINIVLFGLRGGDPATSADCPLCTDTIIVFTLDPITKTAGMINVPRDMFVNIPGFGFSRINTAWTEGERLKLPGGGPALAMRTVSQFLGVPIQYYAQVDFDTFIQFVDMIHGVDIYNDQNLFLQKLGGGRDGIRITCCGMRHLGGQAALAYARCRDPEQGCKDGDIGRSERQQKIIMGIRQKVFSPKVFRGLIGQAPQLYQLFSSGIHTNLSLQDAIELAYLAKDIPLSQIKQGLIDNRMVVYGNVQFEKGPPASILMPIPDKIRDLRDQIFTPGAEIRPLAQGDPRTLMQADAARIRVINSSNTPNLDGRTAHYLMSQGMNVTAGGSSAGPSDRTVVVVYSSKLYALRYLISPLGMIAGSSQIVFRPDASQTVDLEIRLGNDWVGKLPAGY